MAIASCLFLLLLIANSVELKKLIFEDQSKTGSPTTYLLRGYTFYAQSGFQGPANILCKLPSWYNESVMGKANVHWVGQTSNILTYTGNFNKDGEKCVAKNTDGKPLTGWEETTLRYIKGTADLTFQTPSKSVIRYNESGEPFELQCGSGEKIEKLEWYIDGRLITEATTKAIKINEANNSLTLQYPSYRDVGVYVCKTSSRLAYYSIEGAPFFVVKHGKSDDSDNKLEGETVSILHELFGNPLTEVVWSRQSDEDAAREVIGEDFLKSRPDFAQRLKFYPTMNVTNGELELSSLNKDDRAYYYSYAENDHGNSEFKTLVRVKGKLDALWPFLGIVAEVIILVAIILIYERRRMKQDREADEALDQKKPLTSTNNDNVRQRKS